MHPPPGRNHIGVPVRCELLSDFVYSFFEHNGCSAARSPPVLWIAFRFCIFVLWTQLRRGGQADDSVVNCFQILYIRSLNTITTLVHYDDSQLWIAFRFCIFVLWTQSPPTEAWRWRCCELLSDFVYSFFEHNNTSFKYSCFKVVNCFQILYIRSLNTISASTSNCAYSLWIAFRFCIFVLWTQWGARRWS